MPSIKTLESHFSWSECEMMKDNGDGCVCAPAPPQPGLAAEAQNHSEGLFTEQRSKGATQRSEISRLFKVILSIV